MEILDFTGTYNTMEQCFRRLAYAAAENDLRVGGRFLSRMEARDGSAGFDFAGVYDEVREPKLIAYTIDDGRNVTVHFSINGDETKVTETFEGENIHSTEMQKAGWQAILDNFKKYTETH